MEFVFTEAEEAFRQEVREFLNRELPDWVGEPGVDPEKAWEFGRQFLKKLAKRGWLAISWPKEHGGMGATPWEAIVFYEELLRRKAAPWDYALMGVHFIGPGILLYGTEEQKKRFLPGILNATDIWIEAFSEPNTGSDIASLETKAVEDGDYFVVTGEKVWESCATKGDYCLLLARTDPNVVPKHRGLSVFLVDLNTPGVTVRPIPNFTDDDFWGGVTFDGARFHRSSILGEAAGKNKGFYQVMGSLSFERVTAVRHTYVGGILEEMVRYCNKARRGEHYLYEEPLIRQALAEIATDVEIAKLFAYKIAAGQAVGAAPSEESSLAFAWYTQLEYRINDVAMRIGGPFSRLRPGCEWAMLHGWPAINLGDAYHATIAPGTLEIQKQIIATRLLGLPRAY